VKVQLQVVLAAILIASAAAISPAQNAGETQTKCRIAGTVVDAVTQQPLRDAEVMLRGPMGSAEGRSSSATADAEGHFSFDGLSAGRYRVIAYHHGYVNVGPGRAGMRASLATVAPGQNVDDFVVALTPGSTISGHVTTAASKPIADITVQVLKRAYQSGLLELTEVSSTQTNKLGEYRIASLMPGKYFMRVMFLDPPPAKAGSTESYVPTYYPSTSDQTQAVPLELRPGEELGGMDMTLTLRHTFTVKGRVLDAVSKAPVAESEVTLVAREGTINPSPYHADADAKGGFELPGIPPGDYVVSAEKLSESDTPERRSGQKSVRVADTNVNGADIIVARGVEVSGTIHVEGKAKVELSEITGSIEATESWASESSSDIDATHVRSDGSFAFYEVPEGNYRINFSGVPQGFYLKSSGGGDAESAFTVSRGQALRGLDFVLTAGAARIEGNAVNDEQPAPNVAIVLVPSGERRAQPHYYKQMSSDRQGKFVMQSVVPGDYKIFAFEELERGAFMDPEFLAAYEGSGKDVTVKEGDVLSVQVDVISRE
jgi:hypothetical protein